jgi:hypothetical protein
VDYPDDGGDGKGPLRSQDNSQSASGGPLVPRASKNSGSPRPTRTRRLKPALPSKDNYICPICFDLLGESQGAIDGPGKA